MLFAMLLLALEVSIPARHLGLQLALGLALEVGLGSLPLLHDLLGALQFGSLFFHTPRVPAKQKVRSTFARRRNARSLSFIVGCWGVVFGEQL